MTDTTPSVLDMENSAETASYRKSRRMLLEQIAAAYSDYVADARKAHATDDQASAAAAASVRGELRSLCTEMLTRAPIEAIVRFLGAAPDWSDASDRLLTDPAQNAALIELIQSSYPQRTWAKTIDVLERLLALDRASWSAWVKAWGAEFDGAARSVVHGTGAALGGLGSALGGLGDGLGTLLRAGPYILAGLSAVAVAAAITVATRK